MSAWEHGSRSGPASFTRRNTHRYTLSSSRSIKLAEQESLLPRIGSHRVVGFQRGRCPSQVAAETWDPGVDNRGPPGPAPPVRPRPPPPRPPPAGRAGGSSALSPGLDGSQHAGMKRAATGHLRRRTRSTAQLQSHALQGAPRTWQLGPLWKPAAGIFSEDVRWVTSACRRDEAGRTQAGCGAGRGRRNTGCPLRWPHQGGAAPQGAPQQSSHVRASGSMGRGTDPDPQAPHRRKPPGWEMLAHARPRARGSAQQAQGAPYTVLPSPAGELALHITGLRVLRGVGFPSLLLVYWNEDPGLCVSY